MTQHNSTGKTDRLFDKDAYIRSFEAEVLSCKATDNGRFEVILDRTAFFPEAGGQPADTGTFKMTDGGFAAVIDVQERNSGICHITEKPVSGRITGNIDFEVRYERMRNHSGEHLFSGFAHTMFSCTNVGFHLNDEEVTVDFDKLLTKEQIISIEQAANDIIAENAVITARYPSPEELAVLDYRSKLELTENVRIVEIGNAGRLYDRCACCAPHVGMTGEIGMLLVTESISCKGGTRLTMVCGKNAYKLSRIAFDNVKAISAKLSAKYTEAAEAVGRFMTGAEEEKARSAAFRNAYIDMKLAVMDRTDGNMVIFEPLLDRNSLRRLVDRAADLCGGICAGFSGSDETGWNYVLISRTIDLKAQAESLNEKMNGRGGGSSGMIQGTALASREELERIINEHVC